MSEQQNDDCSCPPNMRGYSSGCPTHRANPIHWTEKSPEDFAHRLLFDLEAQIVVDTRETDDLPTIVEVVKIVRSLGLKVSLVVYDDDDRPNHQGPVNSEIFTKCWERCGKPKDFFELDALIPQQVPP